MRSSQWLPVLGVLAAVVGCGGGTAAAPAGGAGAAAASAGGAVTASPGPGGVQTVTIDGTDSLRFVPSTVVVDPGTIRLTLRDTGAVPHDFEIPTLDVHSSTVDGGGAVTVTFTVRSPGRYRFDCSYHVAMGMVGTLVVR